MYNKLYNLLFIVLIVFGFNQISAAPVLVDNGDGTVTDKSKGLIWQKCSAGQNNDASCSGTANTYWLQNTGALSYCNGLYLAGISEWRVPNVDELKSILDRTKVSGPMIDDSFFPATVADKYITSTTYYPDTMSIWAVSFFDGSASSIARSVSRYVRCVATVP